MESVLIKTRAAVIAGTARAGGESDCSHNRLIVVLNSRKAKTPIIAASRRPPVQPIQCDRWRSNIPIQTHAAGLAGNVMAGCEGDCEHIHYALLIGVRRFAC